MDDGQYPIIGSNGEIGRCNQFNNDHPVLTTGRVGTIGNVFKVKDAWITDNTLILDMQSNDIDYDYLYYAVQMIDFKRITTGNAQPLVTAGRLKECEVEVPDLDTQKSIASILSTYDQLLGITAGGIQSKKSNLIKQKQQIMQKIFN